MATGIDLNDSNVLLCGASGGLGSALASDLHAKGARIKAVGRDEARLNASAAEDRMVADLRTPDACRAVVEWATSHGPLDLMINAVGVVGFGNVVDSGVDAMEELFLTNTFVPIMLSRAALPSMSPGGVMVQISGVIAEQNLPGMATYGASKAALKSFNEGFGREARRSKVRILDVRPPHTETGLAGRAIEGEAPRMPDGLQPEVVSSRIIRAIEDGEADLPASAFS